MKWTRQQDAALKAVSAWIARPYKPFFYLAGYAGTGKTTLARHLAGDVVGEVLFGAYTGKAAHVLRSKGCEGATTIHSMIYIPKGQCALHLRELELTLAEHFSGRSVLIEKEVQALEQAIREERIRLAQPAFALNESAPARLASLIVIDEASMVDSRIGSDLLSFGVPVLVLGDPAQLPPVRGEGFFTSTAPDVLLTDIRRQARDNPIIDMATRVRENQALPYGSYGTSKVVDKPDRDEALMAGQILVGRNETRHKYNAHIRSLLGRVSLVEKGDKIVCLRNNHDLGLLNGSVWWVDEVIDDDSGTLSLSIFNEENAMDVYAHADAFLTTPVTGSYYDRQTAEEFCHAEALTVHKAQGSQWEDVLIIDESSAFRQDANKWLYTAITRAAQQVTVVRK